MLTTEVQETSLDPTIVEDDLDVLEKLYREAVQQTKTDIINKLAVELTTRDPTPEALVKYPFFKNSSKLLSDYQEALTVEETDGQISLVVDRDVLQRKNLPENLPSLMEYGNALVKPLPHIRPVVLSSSSPISSVTRRLKEEL